MGKIKMWVVVDYDEEPGDNLAAAATVLEQYAMRMRDSMRRDGLTVDVEISTEVE